MRLRSTNSSKPRVSQANSTENRVATPAVVAPSPKVLEPQALKLATPGKKKPISDREWAARHGRGFIDPPQIVKGSPARVPVKEANGRHMVTATPPIGNVPDPNNAGNVLVCHQKPDLSFITLSIPPASLPLYQTPNNSDGACIPAGTTYCPPGSAPDCAGVCAGSSIVDCNGNCYDPTTTPAAWLLDCNNVCYDTSTIPLNVPDCNGVCGGSAVVDCSGNCNGTKTFDCAGVCDGEHFVDCGGNCNTACAEVTSGSQSSKKVPAPQARQIEALRTPVQAAPQARQNAPSHLRPQTRPNVTPVGRRIEVPRTPVQAHSNATHATRQIAPVQAAPQARPNVTPVTRQIAPVQAAPQAQRIQPRSEPNVVANVNTVQGHLKIKGRR